MGLYSNRLQVPIKELSADWFPEEGELFQDSSDNLYMGDNVTASNALTPINGGGGSTFTPEGLYLSFSDVVTSGDPGAGAFKFNNATAGSITKLYVSTIDQNSASTVAWLNLCTSGVLKVNKASGGMVQFSVSRMVNQTTHFEFDVDHVGGTLPTAGNSYVDFVPDAPGVRELIVGLVQTSTNDPVVTVIKNSYEVDAVVSRTDVGAYRCQIVGAGFLTNTVIDRLLYHDNTNNVTANAQVQDGDIITITTTGESGPADDILGLDGPFIFRAQTKIA